MSSLLKRVFFIFFISFSFIYSVEINVLQQDEQSVLLSVEIDNFEINEVQIKDQVYHNISLKDEPNLMDKGFPSLPHLNRSFIIPDMSYGMSVSITGYESETYENLNILPSKGNLPRNIDINKIVYSKGEVYDNDSFFPGNLHQSSDPYVLRDFRGQVLQINPFQYNPVTRELIVYTRLSVEIEFTEQNSTNELSSSRSFDKLVYDYASLYNNRFLNFETHQSRYSPITEEGEMLIICYDSFCDEMADFVDWKNQKGLKTTLVPKSNAGNTASSIKNYVQDFYNSNNLAYLLLVGDKSQIPTFEVGGGWSQGESDISYAYLSGNDSYPEFFVGRFSANNGGHVETQVERTIGYEKTPVTGSWYSKGLMIASNEGAGSGHDGGESDWQHARNMRSDLLDYTYSDVDEMYDGSHGGDDSSGNPSATMVRNAINSGLGIIHYTGHGDTDVWVTSNFDTGDANSLTNVSELPFVCTVGCKSGDFGGTCLGETFTYATSGGQPTGAIATFMSTIYQSWAPPMEAQDEMVDILVESFVNNRKYTFGGISWNGCMEMNDNYGSGGYDETDHWTLFGDPSVALRTASPTQMSISHLGSIDPSSGAYEVFVNGNYDNAIASLSHNGNYLGASYVGNNGYAVIVLESDISSLSELTLTVTGYNGIPAINQVEVGSSCPGYVSGDLNGDSGVNIQDVVILVNIVLETIGANECQLEFGDLNGDSISNILDVIIMVNIILESL